MQTKKSPRQIRRWFLPWSRQSRRPADGGDAGPPLPRGMGSAQARDQLPSGANSCRRDAGSTLSPHQGAGVAGKDRPSGLHAREPAHEIGLGCARTAHQVRRHFGFRRCVPTSLLFVQLASVPALHDFEQCNKQRSFKRRQTFVGLAHLDPHWNIWPFPMRSLGFDLALLFFQPACVTWTRKGLAIPIIPGSLPGSLKQRRECPTRDLI